MKKIICVIMALIMAAAVIGCKSNPQFENTGLPEEVNRARRNAPEDVLVGIGSANMATTHLSRTTAQTRARTEISQSMETMVENMVRDYSAGSELAPRDVVTFQETITVALSRSTLVGTQIVEEVMERDGTVWIVMYLNKTNVANEINQAAALARLQVPAMASFDAEARMNEAFNNARR